MNNNGEVEIKQPIVERGREELHLEYQECASLSRFSIGLRFTFFTTFITIFVVLVGCYHYVWKSDLEFENLQPWLLTSISLFGVIISQLAWVVDTKNIFICWRCNERSIALEEEMTIENGLYRQIVERGLERTGTPATQTFVMAVFYSLSLLIWLSLLFYSIYQFWQNDQWF